LKTPFDAALRVEQRALDAVRLALITGVAQHQQATDAKLAIEAHIEAERRYASSDWTAMAHPYVARMREHREALAATCTRIDAAIDTLRSEAITAAGQRRSVARAAAAFQTHWSQQQASAEQSQADDFSGAQFFARRPGSGVAASV
jgi:hypothetical protein